MQSPGARDVVLYVLVAQLLAATTEDPPAQVRRAPPRDVPKASHVRWRESLTGRRPRG
jgi:hypothetical protein